MGTPKETHCPRCAATFACNPGPDCWCARLPPLKPPSGAEQCLCPACLGREMEAAKSNRADAPGQRNAK
jgi:hypothetical protein